MPCFVALSLGKRRHADLTMSALHITGICIRKGSAAILLSVPVCDPMALFFRLCFLNTKRAHITLWVRAITIFSLSCCQKGAQMTTKVTQSLLYNKPCCYTVALVHQTSPVWCPFGLFRGFWGLSLSCFGTVWVPFGCPVSSRCSLSGALPGTFLVPLDFFRVSVVILALSSVH